MVQIGRRRTAQRLFENFKKSQKSQFEFQNSGLSFLRLYLLCIVKKFDSIRTKLTEEIDFEVCAMAIPEMALLQQHDARRDILIKTAARRRAAIEARRHSELGAFGTGGVQNWGRNRIVKSNRLVCLSVCLSVSLSVRQRSE